MYSQVTSRLQNNFYRLMPVHGVHGKVQLFCYEFYRQLLIVTCIIVLWAQFPLSIYSLAIGIITIAGPIILANQFNDTSYLKASQFLHTDACTWYRPVSRNAIKLIVDQIILIDRIKADKICFLKNKNFSYWIHVNNKSNTFRINYYSFYLICRY